MIHFFQKDIVFEGPDHFTDPFRYFPHPLVQHAASEVISHIESDPKLSSNFSEGKMLGVLVCNLPSGKLCYISAFSGNVGGHSMVNGFVPPIYDLTDPDGYFKKEEARISEINHRIGELQKSEEMISAETVLARYENSKDDEISRMRESMRQSKLEREQRRLRTSDPDILAELTRQSQFEKAELKRLKTFWDNKIRETHTALEEKKAEISTMKQLRAEMSDRLQEWIFNQYIVHNASGEQSSIHDIFTSRGLVPPGGTGECAAPKLLEYAYRHNLKPLAMGEFWFGKSPDTAVRTHGHFYPSCTSKCGPLLGYMLQGMTIGQHSQNIESYPIILHDDESIIIVEKPSGMPSVPGLDGRTSLQEWLCKKYSKDIYSVHRLDMDTSGVMVYAKTPEAASDLQKQFEEHSIKKVYKARLSALDSDKDRFTTGAKGTIDLPLSADYDERPRQKVDFQQGKPSKTCYEIASVNEDGTMDVLFYPHTGRTHQLRVHSAYVLGLGCPICGDLLYGGSTTARLCLHALSLTFTHPSDGNVLTFHSSKLCY